MRKPMSAVMMGDVVSSTEFEDQIKLYKIFNRIVDEGNSKFKKNILSPLTITLGDEFRGVVESLPLAFEVISFMRLHLLQEQVSARFVIGSASILSNINNLKAWNMMGHGLVESREKLNNKADPNAYRFSFPDRPELEILADAVGLNLTKIENEWTRSQLKHVLQINSHPELPRNKIAKLLKVSENTMYKTLRAADFAYYTQQMNSLKKFLNIIEVKL